MSRSLTNPSGLQRGRECDPAAIAENRRQLDLERFAGLQCELKNDETPPWLPRPRADAIPERPDIATLRMRVAVERMRRIWKRKQRYAAAHAARWAS